MQRGCGRKQKVIFVMTWQLKSFPSQIWKKLFEPFFLQFNIPWNLLQRAFINPCIEKKWVQLERGVLGMRVPLCGLRALAILKATLYFTAEKVHFKLERKIIAFFKSMCCPSYRIQENFKHCYNPLREKWKWGYLIILNKCLASFAVMDILSWLPHMRHIFRDGQSDHLFNHRSLGGR